MIEFLKLWIMNIVIVIFFLLATDILLPKGSIKQYIKVVLGLLIVLIIIKPLLSIKKLGSNFEDVYMETSVFLETDSLMENVETINIYHKKKTMELYEDNIRKNIANAISRELSISANEIYIEFEHEDEKFYSGILKNVFITVTINSNKSSIDKVKKIHIENNKKVIYKDEMEYNFYEKTYIDDLKNIIIKLVPVKKDNIYVKFTIDDGGVWIENTKMD